MQAPQHLILIMQTVMTDVLLLVLMLILDSWNGQLNMGWIWGCTVPEDMKTMTQYMGPNLLKHYKDYQTFYTNLGKKKDSNLTSDLPINILVEFVISLIEHTRRGNCHIFKLCSCTGTRWVGYRKYRFREITGKKTNICKRLFKQVIF